MMGKGSCCRQILIALLTASLVCSAAQAEARITGHVEDGFGRVLPQVSVEVLDVGSKARVAYGVTDSHGDFALANLPSGKFNVFVLVPGFKRFTLHEVHLVDGETLALPVINMQVILGCSSGSETPEGLKIAGPAVPLLLSGRFIDRKANSRAVSGVTVSINQYGQSNAQPTMTETKSDGSFRFVNVSAGDYKLTAAKRGYYPMNTSIVIWQGFLADPYTLELERCPTPACLARDRPIHICE